MMLTWSLPVDRIDLSDRPDLARAQARKLHGPKPRFRQRRAAFIRRERPQKRLHGGPIPARGHQREIVMLLRKRNEAEPRGMRDRRDRDPPVSTMLRNRRRNRIVRARLI